MDGIRTCFLHIDSRYRKNTQAPPNNYKFELPTILRGVREVEVFRAEIPSSFYNISEGQNRFVFYIKHINMAPDAPPTDPYKVEWVIPAGFYSLATVVEQLNALVQASSSGDAIHELDVKDKLTFTADQRTGKISLVSNDENYVTSFDPFYELGIDGKTLFAQVSTSVVPVRLASTEVLFLCVPELSNYSDVMWHSNNPKGDMSDVLARFQLIEGGFHINYIVPENRIYLRRYPLGSGINLKNLTIKFIDTRGNLVDFNGADHSIFLRVVYESE